MHAKLYIVTYNNPNDLDETLTSLFATDWDGHHLDVVVINNHTRFGLRPEFGRLVRVLHNVGRPDFSTGHLARSWNQALLHGFVNLTRPDAEIVITVQNDTLFHPRWFHELTAMHERYSFITFGAGDNFCSYKPEAVRRIGLWDERFCGIGFQEVDYFLRAYIYNYDGSSINDDSHGRVHNPRPGEALARRLHPIGQFDEHHQKSFRHHALNENLFYRKWPGLHPHDWGRFLHGPLEGVHSRIENYIYYPYFEADVEDLAGKNYCNRSRPGGQE